MHGRGDVGYITRLPGKFSNRSSDTKIESAENYGKQLRILMQDLRPTYTRVPSIRYTPIPADILLCTHVFLTNDGVKKPLQPSSDGPFHVLRRSDITMTLLVKGNEKVVSVDRVKAAHLDSDFWVQDATPFRRPRQGQFQTGNA